MKNIIEKEILTLYLEGEINSSNAEDVEKEIDGIVAKEGFKAIKLDMAGVNYISSAGLRIIVRLKQNYDETSIVNVPNNVYEIFEMVGFGNLIKIEKLK